MSFSSRGCELRGGYHTDAAQVPVGGGKQQHDQDVRRVAVEHHGGVDTARGLHVAQEEQHKEREPSKGEEKAKKGAKLS